MPSSSRRVAVVCTYAIVLLYILFRLPIIKVKSSVSWTTKIVKATDNNARTHDAVLNADMKNHHHHNHQYTFGKDNLLSPTYFQAVGEQFARTWRVWDNPQDWCFPSNSNLSPKTRRQQPHGLLFVKTPKTGSSTIAGIVHRIAIWQGKRSLEHTIVESGATATTTCAFRNRHVNAQRSFSFRNYNTSYLFTSVRHPSKRAISRVFFTYVSENHWSMDDDSILQALNTTSHQFGAISAGRGGHQMGYIALRQIDEWSAWHPSNVTHVINRANVEAHARHILQDYDFIMVADRMDESVVALQLLLGVPVTDVLSLSTKVAGSYNLYRKKICKKIYKSFVSPTVQIHLTSQEWYAKNYGDFLIHEAASKSLDLTIEHLGRDRFNSALQGYKKVMQSVHEHCASDFVPVCTGLGDPNPDASECYDGRDEGCGFRCIDRVLQDGKRT